MCYMELYNYFSRLLLYFIKIISLLILELYVCVFIIIFQLIFQKFHKIKHHTTMLRNSNISHWLSLA